MYTSFELENFRGLTGLKLDKLSRINIFTGLNDAGKTSLLEALYLVSSGPLSGIQTIQTIRPSRGQAAFPLGPDIENPWASLFPKFDTSLSIQLRTDGQEGKYSLEITGEPSNVSGEIDLKSPMGETFLGKRMFVRITEERGEANPVQYVQSLATTITNSPPTPNNGALVGPQITYNFELTPNVSAPYRLAFFVKQSIPIDPAAGYSNLRLVPGNLDLVAALRAVDERISDLEVLVVNRRTELHARVDDVLIPFHLLGDGPIALARYLMSMASAPGGAVMIDEVGNGLHHSILPKMWEVLADAARILDVQIFATTHSEESIQAASDVMSETSGGLSVFKLKRSSSGEHSLVTRYSEGTLDAALDSNIDVR